MKRAFLLLLFLPGFAFASDDDSPHEICHSQFLAPKRGRSVGLPTYRAIEAEGRKLQLVSPYELKDGWPPVILQDENGKQIQDVLVASTGEFTAILITRLHFYDNATGEALHADLPQDLLEGRGRSGEPLHAMFGALINGRKVVGFESGRRFQFVRLENGQVTLNTLG